MGMFGCVLVHSGHFAMFTYIRPFLEDTTGIGPQGLSLMLLGFGVANFVGTLVAGWMLTRSPLATLVLMPASVPGQAVLLAVWGLAFGGVPVAWSNWVASAVPDQAESAGGMVVASVQSAIATGAAAGGAMFRLGGSAGVFVAAAVLMLLAALLIALRVRVPAVDGAVLKGGCLDGHFRHSFISLPVPAATAGKWAKRGPKPHACRIWRFDCGIESKAYAAGVTRRQPQLSISAISVLRRTDSEPAARRTAATPATGSTLTTGAG